jgi:hypothetical protein
MLPSPTNYDDETLAGFGSLIQKSAACGITVLPASLNCNLLLHISCMTYTLMSFYTLVTFAAMLYFGCGLHYHMFAVSHFSARSQNCENRL